MWLDQILESLALNPAAAITVIMLFLFGSLSPDVVLIGLACFLVLKSVYGSEWVQFILAIMILILIEVNFHFSFVQIKGIGHLAWKNIFQGNWLILINPWIVSLALPFGLILSAGIIWVRKLYPHLGSEVKRVAKGKHKKVETLSPSKLNKCLAVIKSAAHPDGSILGVCKQSGKPIILTDKNANLHTLAIGTTGSGKTTAISNIIESAICRNLPLIIVDGKGDLVLKKKVEKFAKQHKRKFYGFSMIGESIKYNPLSAGGITSKKDRIIELREWSEDHYRKIAEGYLQTVFEVLEKAKIKVDLHQLSKYFDIPVLRELIRETKDASLGDKISKLSTQAENVSSLKAEIENLVHSEIGHLFDCSQGEVLELPKALNEDAIIYFCLQPLAFPAYANCLGKLIINDIKTLAASQLQSETKKIIYTIFDEFSVFAGNQIVNLINQGRSAGIHAILSTQSLSDLSTVGGSAFVGQVLNNCNNYIIQRQNNPEDAEILAQVVGTSDNFELTSQVSAINGRTEAGTVRSVKEYLIHPDEIKRLGMGEGFFVNKQLFNTSLISFLKLNN